MKTIITEEMRFRQRVVTYAHKHNNNAKAARRYHTSRQQVQRWRKKYDGTVQSLANQSTRPHSHPNQHTKDELKLIKHMYRYHGYEGLAQVYRKLTENGYTRSYDAMCRQIRNMKLNKHTEKPKSYPKSSYKKISSTYPGERVQIDVKFVPVKCIGFSSNHSRYYQITAIDEYSRKRYMELVNENSTYTTSNFLTRLEENLGFKIDLVQTDNGSEFVNDSERTSMKTRFQRVLDQLNIKHKKTRPYSPWQNGIVERSHRIDNERFYNKKRFMSYREMEKSFYRYANRYNNISKKILSYKTPNEIVSGFNFKDVA